MVELALVILYARLPRLGVGKRRLAAGVGDATAHAFYVRCAADAAVAVAGCADEHTCWAVHLSEEEDLVDAQRWLLSLGMGGGECAPQVGASLGERLHRSVSAAFERNFRRVLVCGSDIPALTTETLRSALSLLCRYDCVLGPAHDGGFYLIGLSRPPPAALFSGVPWSTSKAQATVRANAEASGMSVAPAAALPVLRDVDTADDYEWWKSQKLRPSSFAGTI